MNTLTFARPLVLVLVGLPGAGKSFFARQFAEMFSAPLVSYDRLRYELFSEPTFSESENDIIQRLASYQIGELLKTRKSFLVDGGSSDRNARVELLNAVKKQGYDMLLVWVQTDSTTARLRSVKRNPNKIDDQFSAPLSESQFATFVKQHMPPQKENHVVISGRHAFSTQAKMVLRRLSVPHASQAETAHEHKPLPSREAQPVKRPETPPSRRVIIS